MSASDQERQNFAHIVRQAWDQTGLKPEAFAKLLDISRPGLLNWAKGGVDPFEVSTRRLELLAQMRGQTISELISDIRGEVEKEVLPKLLTLSDVEISLGVALHQIKQLKNQGGNYVCTLSQFVRSQLGRLGQDISSPAGFDAFAKRSGFFRENFEPFADDVPVRSGDQRDRLRSILYRGEKPTRGEVQNLLYALEQIRGEKYDAVDVVHLLVECQ